MKIALTIVCSLLLVLAQAVALAVPAAPAAQLHKCCCTGDMPCCKAAPSSKHAPFDATVSVASQQMLSPVPATVFWVWSAAGISLVASVPSVFPISQSAPIFARNCVRLI